jgi:aminopeptidase N
MSCFDSAEYKAIWRVRIRHFRELTPLANAEIKSSSVWSNDKMESTFRSTTPMASMFFAVALGELQSINAVSKNGIAVKVYTPIGYQVYGQVALEVGILIGI